MLLLLGCSSQTKSLPNTPNPSYLVPQEVKEARKAIDNIVNSSVFLNANGYLGSGILVQTDKGQYIWTAAHIIDKQWTQNKNPNEELSEVRLLNTPVIVLRFYYEQGVLKKSETTLANPIAIGKKGEDSDLALLKVFEEMPLTPKNIKFVENVNHENKLPILHAGNINGKSIPGFVTYGFVVETEMYPENIISDILVAPGSSGGGLFNIDGDCIGIVSQAIIQSKIFIPGLIKPKIYASSIKVEEMKKFARKYNVEWAIPMDDPKTLEEADSKTSLPALSQE